MRAYLAFTKKEFTENWRTYKLPILLVVFLLFGMMSPLLAKLTPELLKSLSDTGGVVITLPEPTAMDAWAQFFKNVGQMGMLAIIIVFSGLMATEFSKGTLVNMLTKGMKRHTVVLSKLTAATVIWTVSFLLCLAVSYAYTAYFWDMGTLHYAFLSFFSLWLFGEFLISLLIFGGILFKSLMGSLLFCGGVIVAMTILNIIPNITRYNPSSLSGATLELLNGQKGLSEFMPAFVICAVLIIVFSAASITLFNKKQI
ncbi:MAG: ABC transporter permease [Oscillospiraceae bacterium]|jgi:ABC-2 type transport system permease protein|nr:ABC transporter permease [Oscillospiraceae bacterium]